MLRWCIALGTCVFVTSAQAGDGVLEINQTCAQAGCFPGDAGGFPVEIRSAGSYRLTGNLVPSSVTAISLFAHGVSIDLGGFTIELSSPSASGVSGDGFNHTSVRNGRILGTCYAGVLLGAHARVEGVSVSSCQLGILAADLALLHRVNASSNSTGVHVGGGGVISESVADGNTGDGIRQASGSVVASSATNNGGYGGNFANGLTTVQSSYFAANAGGDVVGARAGGNNYCHDGSCGSDPRRRYFLTGGSHDGSQASAACGAGFHIASLYELKETAALAHAAQLGFSFDGRTPPALVNGWVQTGRPANTSSAVGRENCNNYSTSAVGSFGTVIALGDGPAPAVGSSPWIVNRQDCNVIDRVWCVEN